MPARLPDTAIQHGFCDLKLYPKLLQPRGDSAAEVMGDPWRDCGLFSSRQLRPFLHRAAARPGRAAYPRFGVGGEHVRRPHRVHPVYLLQRQSRQRDSMAPTILGALAGQMPHVALQLGPCHLGAFILALPRQQYQPDQRAERLTQLTTGQPQPPHLIIRQDALSRRPSVRSPDAAARIAREERRSLHQAKNSLRRSRTVRAAELPSALPHRLNHECHRL